jgi:hypothetical protein
MDYPNANGPFPNEQFIWSSSNVVAGIGNGSISLNNDISVVETLHSNQVDITVSAILNVSPRTNQTKIGGGGSSMLKSYQDNI